MPYQISHRCNMGGPEEHYSMAQANGRLDGEFVDLIRLRCPKCNEVFIIVGQQFRDSHPTSGGLPPGFIIPGSRQ